MVLCPPIVYLKYILRFLNFISYNQNELLYTTGAQYDIQRNLHFWYKILIMILSTLVFCSEKENSDAELNSDSETTGDDENWSDSDSDTSV